MMLKKNRNKNSLLYTLLEWTRLLLICGVVAALIMSFIVRKEEVSGDSMNPTIKNGEYVFINIIASYTTEIQRFDVVVARNYKNDDLWVKRVIGLPGETIAYKDDALYVNNKKMEEPFLNKDYIKNVKEQENVKLFTNDFNSRKLEKDEYLLMGDNRLHSLDSRSESVGPFKREQIIANGMFVYHPFKDARFITNGM
ncbi:MAG: signal peptidase I [Longicatena sp.]